MSNVNYSGIDVWDGLHEVLKWILYLPVVLIVTFGFAFIFNWICTIRGNFEGIFLYLQVPLNAGLTVALFVWFSLHLAPRFPRFCAWTLYVLWSVFVILSIVRFFMIAFVEKSISIQQTDVLELLQAIPWLVVGTYLLFYWGKSFSSQNIKADEGI